MISWLRALLCRLGWHAPNRGVHRDTGVGFQCARCPVFVLNPKSSTRNVSGKR